MSTKCERCGDEFSPKNGERMCANCEAVTTIVGIAQGKSETPVLSAGKAKAAINGGRKATCKTCGKEFDCAPRGKLPTQCKKCASLKHDKPGTVTTDEPKVKSLDDYIEDISVPVKTSNPNVIITEPIHAMPFTHMHDMRVRPGFSPRREIEPIEYISNRRFNYNLGSVIRYVSRAGLRDDATATIADLQKAREHIDREIEWLQQTGGEL